MSDYTPQIIPEQVFTDLNDADIAFSTAVWGEEVRGGLSMVDQAVASALEAADEALANAIAEQVATVTDDLTNASANAAARAKTIGDILYANSIGAEHSNKIPVPLVRYSTGSEETFTKSTFPVNCFSYASASHWSDLPDGVGTGSVYYKKQQLTASGSVALITVCEVATGNEWFCIHNSSSGSTIGGWYQNAQLSETLHNITGSYSVDSPLDANTVSSNSIAFCSSSGASSQTITNMPWVGAGWLITYTSAKTDDGKYRFQIAFPFSPQNNKAKFRIRNNYSSQTESENWTQWFDFGGVTNNIDYNIVQNSYAVSASPSITQGNLYVLTSTGDTTDRTADIAAVLAENGSCVLGTGTFYVSNLSLSANQSLRGSGIGNTILRLSGTGEGYAVSMGTRSSISDMTIYGGASSISATNGGRNGIAWVGTYVSSEEQGTYPIRGQIENLHIYGFSGAGIICSNSSQKIYSGLNAVNVNIYLCWAGIYIPIYSEYHRFTNFEVDGCTYGVINNGGNNMFVNCGFNANGTGFFIDNSTGQSPNNSHGSAVGCTFNHSGSNEGTAVKLDGVTAGYVFSGCQFFYGELDIKNSVGINISSCNFGNSVPITIDGGGLVLFSNNIFRASPSVTKTNTPVVQSVGCYLRDGTSVTV